MLLIVVDMEDDVEIYEVTPFVCKQTSLLKSDFNSDEQQVLTDTGSEIYASLFLDLSS